MRGAGFQIGTVVGDRRIDAVVGEGGMGVVYRAWNLRLRRIEAVKVIADALVTDRDFRERFERETVIAASIEHPHVITLYDSGEGPDGQLYLAMRYIEGTNLAELVDRRGRLDPPLAAQLISQVASALDAAHSQGLVHRDVKPANILIAGRDGEHHAFLTDFGLAKHVASETMATGAGTLLGTVDYMAPEQARGDPVDALADIYALGATLFKALTGTVPYPAEHDLARIVAKLSGPPPLVTQTVEGIPPAFDAVIARAMAMDAQDRYPSAGELGRAARAAAGQPSRSHQVMPLLGVGSVLGDCLLDAVAGEGGMAVVYKATQLKLDRTVALKVMSRDLVDDAVFRARFQREWKIASSIDHPNVIPIYAAGESGGVLYIVMRFVDGGSLKEALLARGRLEPERAVEVIEQVASALDAAHERGLVHRDVKPGNVLIEEATGRVFLADFGLAKELADPGADGSDLTDQGQILGTARYMPPERNNTVEDGIQGDVYSLGCVLWDLLGGTERLSLSRVNAVPPALAAVVTRATALDPKARFASAGDLAGAARAAITPGASPAQEHSKGETTAGPVLSRQRRKPFEPKPLSTGLSERVLKLCDTVAALTPDGELRDALDAVRGELIAPLRVAVVGAPGSGRSTLVNALVGRRIMSQAHDAGIAAVVCLTYGAPERVEITRTDGTRGDLALTQQGALPAELGGGAPADIAGLQVWLPVDSLKTLSLVCPPAGEPAHADAYLVTLAADVDADSAGSVNLPRELPQTGVSAVNTAVVLTHADLLAEGGRQHAEHAKHQLGSRTAAVTPFVGQLAEAANAGLIADRQIDTLQLLSGLPKVVREELLDSPDEFRAKAPTPPADREQLLATLGLYGIRAALELADAGQLTVIGLIRRLRELSGIEEIDRQVDGFHQRADALKAGGALARLEQLSFRWPNLAFLRDQVEAARLEPAMHVLDLTKAYARAVTDDLDVPRDLLDTLERLIIGRTPGRRLGLEDDTDPASLRVAALDGFQAWKMFENSGQSSPAARRVARVAARSFELLAKHAELASG